MSHIPVLLHESIDGLDIKSGDTIVDCTLGGGGHTFEMVTRFGKSVKIICLDLDADAIDRAKSLIGEKPNDIVFKTASFSEIDKVLRELNIEKVDRILIDLGISSFQLDTSGRGFSFTKDEPLLMTMKKNPSGDDLTAYDIVNSWDETTLADIIYGFGEEKYSRKIARAIVEARREKAIATTFDLVKVIDDAVGKYYRRMKIHPATRTFQAIRIAVNGELDNLKKVIQDGFRNLSRGGRIAIISFHSLEDRIVKQEFVKFKEEGYGNIITKKPITPSEKEIKLNLRSRSAKLRIIEKI